MKVDNPRAQFGAAVTGVDADAKKIQPRPASTRTGDAVQLSGDLRLVDEAIRLASVDASPRADEVAKARGLFERGELGTDAARLADRILDSLLDQSR
jgi:hypothetical protein